MTLLLLNRLSTDFEKGEMIAKGLTMLVFNFIQFLTDLTYVERMKAINFINSWPALWLWMHYWNDRLIQAEIDTVYTFRKARLDLHFSLEDQPGKLVWEKHGNQAVYRRLHRLA